MGTVATHARVFRDGHYKPDNFLHSPKHHGGITSGKQKIRIVDLIGSDGDPGVQLAQGNGKAWMQYVCMSHQAVAPGGRGSDIAGDLT